MALPLAALLMYGLATKKNMDNGAAVDEERNRRHTAEDEDRAFQRGQRERTLREQGKADAYQTSMEDAAKPITVKDGSSYQPANDDEGNAMPPNPTVGMLDVAGQKFTDPNAAQAAAAGMNTAPATIRRQAKVAAGAGKPLEAKQYEDIARKLEEEGTLHFIDKNYGRLPSVADIKAGKKLEFELDGVNDFNAAGVHRIPDGAKGRAKVIKLPSGQEITDFEVVDKDGNVVAPSARRIEAMYGFSRAERARMENDQFKDGKTFEHQGAMERIAQQNADTAAAARREQAGHNAGMLQLARDKAAAEKVAETPEATFDRKTASAIAADMVKKEAEAAATAGTVMTGPQVAKRVNEVVGALFQEHTNNFIKGKVQASLGAAQTDPTAYAAEYGKALKLMPQSVLAQMGFKPPASAAASPPKTPAASMAAAAKPAGRPAENYAPFEAMSDADLASYVKAGNELAIEVSKRRAAFQAAEPVNARGFTPL